MANAAHEFAVEGDDDACSLDVRLVYSEDLLDRSAPAEPGSGTTVGQDCWRAPKDAAVGGCSLRLLVKKQAEGFRLSFTPPRPGHAELWIATATLPPANGCVGGSEQEHHQAVQLARVALRITVEVKPAKWFVWGHPTLKCPGEGAADRNTPLYGEISYAGVDRILRVCLPPTCSLLCPTHQ